MIKNIFLMFALRINLFSNGVYPIRHFEFNNKGRHKGESPSTRLRLLSNKLVRSDLLILFISKSFIMRTKKTIKSNKEQLTEIKLELQENYPLLKRLKVKPFYNTGRVIAYASIGKRRIRVTGSLFNIMDKFITEYQDRLPTAFTNLNTI
jgi:hypothetical protein